MRNVGEKDAQADFERSLGELGLDYVDLCLVHMPFGDVYGTWRVLERELRRGRVRAIGVSNFDPVRLQDLISNAEVAPMVNQYQSNPYAPAEAVAGFCRMHGIAFQAWGPLGQGKSRLLSDPVLEGIAQAHGCSVAQAVLAWQLGRGIAVVAKSTHEERLRQNLEATRFSLTPEEMLTVSALAKPEEAGMLDNPAFVAHLCAGWHEDA
jgi:diketogulonate reductase-like aldo/keto reductase